MRYVRVMLRPAKSAVVVTLCLAAVVASATAADGRLHGRSRVVGTVRACRPGVGTLVRMEVAAVNARHHVVGHAAVQGGQFSFRLAPGRYVLELKSVGGNEIAHQAVSAVAGRTETVSFTVPSPCAVTSS